MRAWLLESLTGLSALRRVDDFPMPTPGPGEALLRVEYAALNPADRYLAQREYPARPKLPHILGRDAIGTVIALGEGVPATLAVGSRRIILRCEVGVNAPGTLAEYVCVPAESLIEPPAEWSAEQAAGAALVYLTAWQALTQFGPVPPKSLCLVSGATGGVGVASVQLSSLLGVEPIALSRSADKAAKLLPFGANLSYDPTQDGWPRRVRSDLQQLRPGHEVRLAIDNIGGTVLPQMIELLGLHGRVSCVGRLSGPVPEFNTATLFFRRIWIGGVAMATWTASECVSAWGTLTAMLRRGGMAPVVDQVFPWPELPAAFERLQQGPMGKVLVKVAE